MTRFYVGLHELNLAHWCDRFCVSVNRLRLPKRKAMRTVPGRILLDSGGATEIINHGHYRKSPEEHLAIVEAFLATNQVDAVCPQDWICGIGRGATGLSVEEHQERTTASYRYLSKALRGKAYVMPILQGESPDDYIRHLRQYDIRSDAWVGVGSLKGRKSKEVVAILDSLKDVSPRLMMHGFGLGLKMTKQQRISKPLFSADSMAWAVQARRRKMRAAQYRDFVREYLMKVMGHALSNSVDDSFEGYLPDEALGVVAQLRGYEDLEEYWEHHAISEDSRSGIHLEELIEEGRLAALFSQVQDYFPDDNLSFSFKSLRRISYQQLPLFET